MFVGAVCAVQVSENGEPPTKLCYVYSCLTINCYDKKHESDFETYIQTLAELGKLLEHKNGFKNYAPVAKSWISEFKNIFSEEKVNKSQKYMSKFCTLTTNIYLSLFQSFHEFDPNYTPEFCLHWRSIISRMNRGDSFTSNIDQFKIVIQHLRTAETRFEQLAILTVLKLYAEGAPLNDLNKLIENDNVQIVNKLAQLMNSPTILNQHEFLRDVDETGFFIESLKPKRIICKKFNIRYDSSEHEMWLDFNIKAKSIIFITVSLTDNTNQTLAIGGNIKISENVYDDHVLEIRGIWDISINTNDGVRTKTTVKVYLSSQVQSSISRSVKTIFHFDHLGSGGSVSQAIQVPTAKLLRADSFPSVTPPRFTSQPLPELERSPFSLLARQNSHKLNSPMQPLNGKENIGENVIVTAERPTNDANLTYVIEQSVDPIASPDNKVEAEKRRTDPNLTYVISQSVNQIASKQSENDRVHQEDNYDKIIMDNETPIDPLIKNEGTAFGDTYPIEDAPSDDEGENESVASGLTYTKEDALSDDEGENESVASGLTHTIEHALSDDEGENESVASGLTHTIEHALSDDEGENESVASGLTHTIEHALSDDEGENESVASGLTYTIEDAPSDDEGENESVASGLTYTIEDAPSDDEGENESVASGRTYTTRKGTLSDMLAEENGYADDDQSSGISFGDDMSVAEDEEYDYSDDDDRMYGYISEAKTVYAKNDGNQSNNRFGNKTIHIIEDIMIVPPIIQQFESSSSTPSKYLLREGILKSLHFSQVEEKVTVSVRETFDKFSQPTTEHERFGVKSSPNPWWDAQDLQSNETNRSPSQSIEDSTPKPVVSHKAMNSSQKRSKIAVIVPASARQKLINSSEQRMEMSDQLPAVIQPEYASHPTTERERFYVKSTPIQWKDDHHLQSNEPSPLPSQKSIEDSPPKPVVSHKALNSSQMLEQIPVIIPASVRQKSTNSSEQRMEMSDQLPAVIQPAYARETFDNNPTTKRERLYVKSTPIHWKDDHHLQSNEPCQSPPQKSIEDSKRQRFFENHNEIVDESIKNSRKRSTALVAPNSSQKKLKHVDQTIELSPEKSSQQTKEVFSLPIGATSQNQYETFVPLTSSTQALPLKPLLRKTSNSQTKNGSQDQNGMLSQANNDISQARSESSLARSESSLTRNLSQDLLHEPGVSQKAINSLQQRQKMSEASPAAIIPASAINSSQQQTIMSEQLPVMLPASTSRKAMNSSRQKNKISEAEPAVILPLDLQKALNLAQRTTAISEELTEILPASARQKALNLSQQRVKMSEEPVILPHDLQKALNLAQRTTAISEELTEILPASARQKALNLSQQIMKMSEEPPAVDLPKVDPQKSKNSMQRRTKMSDTTPVVTPAGPHSTSKKSSTRNPSQKAKNAYRIGKKADVVNQPFVRAAKRKSKIATVVEYTSKQSANWAPRYSSLKRNKAAKDSLRAPVHQKSIDEAATDSVHVDESGAVYVDKVCVFADNDELQRAAQFYIANDGLRFLKTENFKASSARYREKCERELKTIHKMIDHGLSLKCDYNAVTFDPYEITAAESTVQVFNQKLRPRRLFTKEVSVTVSKRQTVINDSKKVTFARRVTKLRYTVDEEPSAISTHRHLKKFKGLNKLNKENVPVSILQPSVNLTSENNDKRRKTSTVQTKRNERGGESHALDSVDRDQPLAKNSEVTPKKRPIYQSTDEAKHQHNELSSSTPKKNPIYATDKMMTANRAKVMSSQMECVEPKKKSEPSPTNVDCEDNFLIDNPTEVNDPSENLNENRSIEDYNSRRCEMAKEMCSTITCNKDMNDLIYRLKKMVKKPAHTCQETCEQHRRILKKFIDRFKPNQSQQNPTVTESLRLFNDTLTSLESVCGTASERVEILQKRTK